MHHGLEELAVGEGAADQEEEEEDQRRRGPHRVTTLSTTVRVSFTENYVLSPAEFRFLTVCWCGVTWRSPLIQAQVEEEYYVGGGGGRRGRRDYFSPRRRKYRVRQTTMPLLVAIGVSKCTHLQYAYYTSIKRIAYVPPCISA